MMRMATLAGITTIEQLGARRTGDFARREKHPVSIAVTAALEMSAQRFLKVAELLKDAEAAYWILVATDRPASRRWHGTLERDGIPHKKALQRLRARYDHTEKNQLVNIIARFDGSVAERLITEASTAITGKHLLQLVNAQNVGFHITKFSVEPDTRNMFLAA